MIGKGLHYKLILKTLFKGDADLRPLCRSSAYIYAGLLLISLKSRYNMGIKGFYRSEKYDNLNRNKDSRRIQSP